MCDSLVVFGKADQFLLNLQQQYPVLLVAIQCVCNELLKIHSCAIRVLLCAAVYTPNNMTYIFTLSTPFITGCTSRKILIVHIILHTIFTVKNFMTLEFLCPSLTHMHASTCTHAHKIKTHSETKRIMYGLLSTESYLLVFYSKTLRLWYINSYNQSSCCVLNFGL